MIAGSPKRKIAKVPMFCFQFNGLFYCILLLKLNGATQHNVLNHYNNQEVNF